MSGGLIFSNGPDDMAAHQHICRWRYDSIPSADFAALLRVYRMLRSVIPHYGSVGLSRTEARERVGNLFADCDWFAYLWSK